MQLLMLLSQVSLTTTENVARALHEGRSEADGSQAWAAILSKGAKGGWEGRGKAGRIPKPTKRRTSHGGLAKSQARLASYALTPNERLAAHESGADSTGVQAEVSGP